MIIKAFIRKKTRAYSLLERKSSHVKTFFHSLHKNARWAWIRGLIWIQNIWMDCPIHVPFWDTGQSYPYVPISEEEFWSEFRNMDWLLMYHSIMNKNILTSQHVQVSCPTVPLHYTLDFFKSDRFLKLMVELRVCTHAWYHLKGHYIWKFLTKYWFPLLSFKDFIEVWKISTK